MTFTEVTANMRHERTQFGDNKKKSNDKVVNAKRALVEMLIIIIIR